jgi:uncharacterized protein (DUF305 family)
VPFVILCLLWPVFIQPVADDVQYGTEPGAKPPFPGAVKTPPGEAARIDRSEVGGMFSALRATACFLLPLTLLRRLPEQERVEMKKDGGMKYRRFFAMIATSTAVMFGLMYLNTYSLDHVQFSETRFWMALIMGAAMAVVMLTFMLGMYTDARKNALIYVGSLVVLFVALWLVRSQQTIGDLAYMRAMIPHHSIAILTSERAQIRDPRTRELASAIIEAQRREIAEMKELIEQIEAHGVGGTPDGAAPP